MSPQGGDCGVRGPGQQQDAGATQLRAHQPAPLLHRQEGAAMPACLVFLISTFLPAFASQHCSCCRPPNRTDPKQHATPHLVHSLWLSRAPNNPAKTASLCFCGCDNTWRSPTGVGGPVGGSDDRRTSGQRQAQDRPDGAAAPRPHTARPQVRVTATAAAAQPAARTVPGQSAP